MFFIRKKKREKNYEKIVFEAIKDFKSNYSKSKNKNGFWIKGLPDNVDEENLEDIIKEKNLKIKKSNIAKIFLKTNENKNWDENLSFIFYFELKVI